MKKILAFILFVAPLFLAAQETNEQLWEKANAYYTTEEYQQAVSMYETIVASGEESAKTDMATKRKSPMGTQETYSGSVGYPPELAFPDGLVGIYRSG